jgi:hypothetical protein
MDLFGLGATLYEAATDRLAFEPSRKAGELFYPQLESSPRPIRCFSPRVPAALERAILALLAPEPSGRPESALEAMSCLAAALPKRQAGLWPGWVSIEDTAAS